MVFSGGGSYGSATVTLAPGTTATTHKLPEWTAMLLLRAPSTNTDNVYVKLASNAATKGVTTGDLLIRPGESIQLDFSSMLMLKKVVWGKLTRDDCISYLHYYSASTQALYVDAVAL